MALIFIDAVVKATIILAAATVVTATLLRRASAAQRHLVWTIALLASLALPVLTASLPRWQVPVISMASPLAAGATAEDSSSRQMAARLLSRLQDPTTTAEPLTDQDSRPQGFEVS